MTLNEIKKIGQFPCNVANLNRMCLSVKRVPGMVYDLIAEYGGLQDTVTREAIFSYVADKYHNGNYDKVYTAWLYKN